MKLLRKAIWPDNTYELVNNDPNEELAILGPHTQLPIATNALEHTGNPSQEGAELALVTPKMNFEGQGEAANGSENEDKSGPLVIPVINFGENRQVVAAIDNNGDNSPLLVPTMNFDEPEKKNGQGTVRDTEDEPLMIPTVNFGNE